MNFSFHFVPLLLLLPNVQIELDGPVAQLEQAHSSLLLDKVSAEDSSPLGLLTASRFH